MVARPTSCYLVALTLLGVSASGGVAHAEEEDGGEARVALSYEAPSTCPDVEAFVRQLSARVPRLVVVATGPSDVILRVRIDEGGRGFRGTLGSEARGGEKGERVLEASTCEEIATALALVAAMTCERARRPRAAEPAKDTPEPAPAELAVAPPPPPVVDTPPPAGSRVAWSAGVGGGALLGVTTQPLWVAPVFVDAVLPPAGLLAPAARLAFVHTARDVEGEAAAAVTFDVGRLDLCPVAALRGPARLELCARGEAGALRVRGLVEPSRPTTRPWLAAALVSRARFSLVSRVFADLEVAAELPIVRDRFFVQPNATVFTPALLGASLAASVGVRLAP